MKNRLFIVIIWLVFISNVSVLAQESSTGRTASNYIDFGLASTLNNNVISLAVNRLHPVAFNKRFSIGFGIRGSFYYGSDNGFVTAPAKVSEGNFFKKQNEAKLDTLYMSHSSLGALNAVIYLDFLLAPKMRLQFNIDAIGFSFGAKRAGRFESRSLGNPDIIATASVAPLNLLLTGDYDWGSLNSELAIKYSLSKKISLNAGFCFFFSEFTSEQKLAFNNDRFRKKSLMPMAGLSIQF